MSSPVDDRARAAATAIREAVAAADLHLMEAGPAARPPADPAPPGRWALAGAVAAAVIVVGLFAGPSLLMAPAGPGVTAPPDAVATTTPPTTTTSSPVAAPVAPSTTEPPPTTAADVVPPLLEITDPAEGSVVVVELLTFRGITEPGARVFAGRYEATVALDGSWELALVLAPGTNTVRFTAADATGNVAEASVTVAYQAPIATTTTTKPATTTTTKAAKAEVAGFTALSVYGSCSEDPPYDDYRGTGEPGSTVWVGSAYGSASTVVREDGTWEVRVVFSDAPVGVPFEVKAKDELGRKVMLQFTALAG